MKVKTCLRFPGGKFYATKYILPFFNVNHDTYIEPFIGGASMFLAKDLAPKLNWINDIDSNLINFYLIIQKSSARNKLYKLLRNEIADKVRHKDILNFKPKNSVERAFKFFYLNRTSFSGIMNKPRWGYLLGSSVTPDKWTTIIDPVARKLNGVKITNLDFRDLFKEIEDNKSILLYLDPPYYKASKSIYNHEFSHQDHIDLMNLLKDTKCKFVLSYEDSNEIRKMYSWANIHKITFRYFMSEGRRQEGNELIITNFQLAPKTLLNFSL